MAITRLLRHRLRDLLASPLALGVVALAGAGCTIYPSTPADPGYAADVRPIFLAHCTRCHGAGPEDGGANLNTASVPGVVYSDAGPPQTTRPTLTQFGDICAPAVGDGGPPNCNNSNNCTVCGALTYASLIQMRVHSTLVTLKMPPPPAPSLDDWELKVIDAWAANPLP